VTNLISIGALAEETGVKVPTIRYYESVGLLPEPDRTESNRRVYGAEAVRRLRFIRHARELGFEVGAIRQLLGLADQPDRPCHEADVIARAHLADIDQKIGRLIALRSEVQHMVDQCAQGEIRECRVIEVLADHKECLHEAH
jgi:DNA-binding transcriptional MerR regulator